MNTTGDDELGHVVVCSIGSLYPYNYWPNFYSSSPVVFIVRKLGLMDVVSRTVDQAHIHQTQLAGSGGLDSGMEVLPGPQGDHPRV